MKHLLYSQVFMVASCSFRLHGADTTLVSKERFEKIDQSPVVLNLTLNMTSKNKNNVDNTSETTVETQQVSANADDTMTDMSPDLSKCKRYFGTKLKECMHRLPRDVYQKIMFKINPEELDYYYRQLTEKERIMVRFKKFSHDEWVALRIANPTFTTPMDSFINFYAQLHTLPSV